MRPVGEKPERCSLAAMPAVYDAVGRLHKLRPLPLLSQRGLAAEEPGFLHTLSGQKRHYAECVCLHLPDSWHTSPDENRNTGCPPLETPGKPQEQPKKTQHVD